MRPLRRDGADAPGRGMDQDGVAGPNLERVMQQVVHRQALSISTAALVERHRIRQLDGARRRHVALSGVAAERQIATDAIADLETADACADCRDLARTFMADDRRQIELVSPLRK